MRKFLGFLVIISAILGGCQGFGLDILQTRTSPVRPSETAAPRQQQVSPTPAVEATRTIRSDPNLITIWLPPQLDPTSTSPGSLLFKTQLESFEALNPGIKVQVRVKALSGAGGLLESLAAANTAAPQALPSLVALNRPDLEEAAIKGLVLPLGGTNDLMNDADWYDYARQMAMVQDNTFGLPFGGDSLLIIYRPSKVGTIPNTWDGINRRGLALIFPAADPQALLTLALYQSMDGPMVDAQGRQTLSVEALGAVLKLYADGVQQNVFPYWLSTLQNDGQAWQAFRDQRAHIIVTTNARYLADFQSDTAVAILPGMKANSLSLANGWIWAVTDPQPERRQMSIRLSEHLVKGDFLAGWTEATGYLPTRPSSLAGWTAQSMKAQFNQLALISRPRPANYLTSIVGPILQEAVLSIIKRQSDPARAAQVAFDRLSVPKTR